MTKRIFFSLLATAAILSADTLTLRNGSKVDGSFIGGDNGSIRFAVGTQVNTYNLSDIDSIKFTSGSQSYAPASNAPDNQAPPPAPGTSQAPAAPSAPNPPSSSAPPPPPPPQTPPDSYAAPASAPPSNGPLGIQVPAGTQLVVRLIDPVNSERDSLGQTYRASVDQPVVVNGQTVIPRGADVVATLSDTQKSGKIEGKTVLTIDLKSVTVNGRTYDIVTTGVAEASASRGERSAKVIGGTAALGAIIGAIAGGGKGAAIGAGSGAAVGTAAQVATSGQKVRVPSETRLTFTLQNPVDL
ncbi:MAG: hypothetical protein JO097_06190 [Acidobacteriaceae bacterium]|nr:hypothetical protein [Acidobacteriaceae bacterium]MBV9295909.1 hypothetical protein [Acidobacteriaceae bacterium]MBV9765139.1 hypothetical protein [Acidobacteriaceae bacterium]